MKASVPCLPFGADCGPVHIGIDSGSTTIKLVVIDQNANILFESYRPNLGNPIPLVKETLLKLYEDHPGLQVATVTAALLRPWPTLPQPSTFCRTWTSSSTSAARI